MKSRLSTFIDVIKNNYLCQAELLLQWESIYKFSVIRRTDKYTERNKSQDRKTVLINNSNTGETCMYRKVIFLHAYRIVTKKIGIMLSSLLNSLLVKYFYTIIYHVFGGFEVNYMK